LSGDNFVDFKLRLPSTANKKNQLNNKNYKTLPSDDFDFKGSFDFDRTIRVMTIKQNTPDDGYSSKFEIFSRLNSGGIPLKAQEIRMSLFYSDFYNSILDMNKNKKWRTFYGKKEPELHLQDVECILRALAMFETKEGYKSPMKLFLNKFSDLAKSFNSKKIEELKKIFEDFLDCCDGAENEFKNEKGKFVVSYFDCIFVAICNKLKNKENLNKKIDVESIKELKKDDDFQKLTIQASSSTKSVMERIEKASKIIRLS
jgi:hypothetical protein